MEGKLLKEWFASHLPERYLARSLPLEPDHRACLVVGPRQAGKSTLIWKHLAEHPSGRCTRLA